MKNETKGTETQNAGLQIVENAIAPRPTSDIMTAKEAAAYLRCSIKSLYNYKWGGKLKGYSLGGKSGGSLRFKKSDLDILLFGKRGA